MICAPVASASCGDELAADDERLLVGQREVDPLAQRGDGRAEARRADERVEHEVGARLEDEPDEPLGAGEHLAVGPRLARRGRPASASASAIRAHAVLARLATSCSHERSAERPTSSRSSERATMSSACVPIEPVEPRMSSRRMRSAETTTASAGSARRLRRARLIASVILLLAPAAASARYGPGARHARHVLRLALLLESTTHVLRRDVLAAVPARSAGYGTPQGRPLPALGQAHDTGSLRAAAGRLLRAPAGRSRSGTSMRDAAARGARRPRTRAERTAATSIAVFDYHAAARARYAARRSRHFLDAGRRRSSNEDRRGRPRARAADARISPHAHSRRAGVVAAREIAPGRRRRSRPSVGSPSAVGRTPQAPDRHARRRPDGWRKSDPRASMPSRGSRPRRRRS